MKFVGAHVSAGGRDNYSSITPEQLVEELNASVIRNYTMGLEGNGGVNEMVLDELAVNGQIRFKFIDIQ